MEIAELESVLAAEELRSFTEAAYRLSYSPSTVSKHIRRVEEELGIRIFERGTKSSSVALTKAGADMIESIRATVAEYHRMTSRAHGLLGSAQLSVGYMPLISGFGEAALIAGFAAAYPKIKIIESSHPSDELLRTLDSGKADGVFIPVFGFENGLEVLRRNGLSAAMDCIACGEYRDMHLAISAHSPFAARGNATLEELKNEEFIFRTGDGDTTHMLTGDPTRTFRQKFEKLGLEPKMRFVGYIGHGVWQQVAAGRCVLPSSQIGMSYQGVSYIHVPDWNNCVQLFFVFMKANDSLALRAFRKYIKENSRAAGQ